MILLETAIKGSWFRLQDVNKVRGSEMFHQIAEVMDGGRVQMPGSLPLGLGHTACMLRQGPPG